MLRIKLLLFLMLATISAVSVHAQRPESLYKAGVRAESKGNLDTAYEAFKRAHEKKPEEPKYLAAYLKARLYASSAHIQTGQNLRDVLKLQDGLAEFQRAAEIDPSSFAAQQEIRRTAEMIRKKEAASDEPPQPKLAESSLEKAAALASGPVTLKISSNEPLSLHMNAPIDVIYRTIGKMAGLNVLIDPELKPQKVSVDLRDVSLRDALYMVALQSKTFWRPVSSNSILVSLDNSGKRKELEQDVMRTFYLQNASTPGDLQQAASTLKGILDISHIQITPEQRALTIRATPDQMVLAQRLLQDVDKPRAEVVVDITVMEISRGRIRTLGVVPPTSLTATIQPNAGTTSTTGTSTGTSGGSTSSGFSLRSLSPFTANNVLVSIPNVSLTALMSESNTKVLQKPQIRMMDSEKATLKIGDRIPIATGSYQGGLAGGVNTQFTYIDVGVNVDITAYVHANRDVTLKMSFEVSSVTGEQTISGVTEPTIGQRRIDHQVRLADGEVNLIGGILQDTESHSLSGYPGLAKLPILKYLFGQENKDHEQTEVVFAVTPHIIRSNEINDENQKVIDIGSGNAIAYRAEEPTPISPPPGPTNLVPQQPMLPAKPPSN